jgi:hypothetical protein
LETLVPLSALQNAADETATAEDINESSQSDIPSQDGLPQGMYLYEAYDLNHLSERSHFLVHLFI